MPPEEEELEIWEEEEEEEVEEKGYLALNDDDKFVITDEYITESRPLRLFYRSGFIGAIPAPIRGKSSTIVRKALEFCKDRGEIRKKHWNDDENTLKQKLKDFDDNFFQHNQEDAIDLADVACRLQIKSLYYLMRKPAADMLAQKTPDEIYKLMEIHYDENKTTDCELQEMKTVVGNAGWAFRQIM